MKERKDMALTLSKKAQAVKPSSTLAITAKANELKETIPIEKQNTSN
jgi:hypothetical protein